MSCQFSMEMSQYFRDAMVGVLMGVGEMPKPVGIQLAINQSGRSSTLDVSLVDAEGRPLVTMPIRNAYPGDTFTILDLPSFLQIKVTS